MTEKDVECSYTFNDLEMSALLLGLSYATDGVLSCIEKYYKAGETYLVDEQRKLLQTIKSLRRRFLPNWPVDEWEWGEGDD